MDHLLLDQKLGSVISVLQRFRLLYAFLYIMDKAGSGVIFGDASHTISYNIAIRAKAGNELCIELCQVLNILSPDHCAWALSNEKFLRMKV